MTIKDFEEKYDEVFDNPEDEAVAAKQLALELEDIDKQNELFDQAVGHFKEDVHEWDDLTPEEFAEDKTGLNHNEDDFSNRGRGLIHEEPRDMEYTPQELERVEGIFSKMNRSSIPEFYDSRALGNFSKTKIIDTQKFEINATFRYCYKCEKSRELWILRCICNCRCLGDLFEKSCS